jgi:group II intron reverse transcriptase/maturase
MREIHTILEILRERGGRREPLERIYRLLYQPGLYLHAYGKIYRNAGATTPGVTEETVDGMSLEKVRRLIETLRHHSYQWKPARRIYIPKKNSDKKRPLGIPTWSDKLLQEVIRLLLEAYYEPQFSDHSHGFRPRRGCHTALREIAHTWPGTVWFIEGDISRCFDTLDHSVLMSILRERIHDSHFLRLIEHLLQAGYLEEWEYHTTLSGSPQGGVISPLLANIYLDRLDQFVEKELLPASHRGTKRKANPEYVRLLHRAAKQRKDGHLEEARELLRQAQTLPSQDPDDPGFRRLRYVRYADDFLLGFVGPRSEAEEIKTRIGQFLHEQLHLELSETKTLITHARSGNAHFLSYEIGTMHNDQKQHQTYGHRRCINGKIGLKLPLELLREKCRAYMKDGKPIHRAERLHDTLFSIVAGYQQEYRGLVEYYRLAYNLHQFGHLEWILRQSLTKTLAHKLKISVTEVWERYGVTLQTEQGPRRGLQVTLQRGEGQRPLVADWGGISLKWCIDAVLDDHPRPIWNTQRTALEQRLLANECELCGSQERVQVHHVRALKDLQRPGRGAKPEWMQQMAARHRKTLIVCKRCHDAIHAGQLQRHETGA